MKALETYDRITYRSNNTTVNQNYPDEEMFTLQDDSSNKHRTLNTDGKTITNMYPPTDGFELKEGDDNES